MIIKVRKEKVYGVDRIYPVCETAKLLLKLSGPGKTFTLRQIETLKELGYELQIEAETL